MIRPLSRQPKSIVFAAILALLFSIAWLDLATGHEISLILFYAGSIVLTGFSFGNKTTFLFAGLVGLISTWVDVMTGHAYSSSTILAGGIASRFALFLLVALTAITTRERNSAANARISLLEHARKLEKQIIDISDYEQQRIGRDLHDGLCQCLAAIGCAATALRMDLKQQSLEKLAAKAGEIETLLEESVKQARELAHGLVPVQLDEAGLSAALQELSASTSRLLGMDCTFEVSGDCRAIRNEKATHLYRIAQEAINNATTHGKAHNVEVRLSANSSAMNLSIADDGRGFSKTGKEKKGVGIGIMRYRANIVGGEFEIEDRPTGGTIVSCMVPTRALS